ncbi:MAG: glycosyltransferase N-terminal domain-containing protein [Bacteroidia bacterium]
MIKNILIISIGLLYDLIVLPLFFIALLISPFWPKIKQYIQARFSFNSKPLKLCDTIFFCSSIGELDQIVPLIELMKTNGYRPCILLHSQNGYKYAKQLGFENISYSPPDFFIVYLFLFLKTKPKHSIINRNEVWPGFVYASSLFSHIYLCNFIDRRYPRITKYLLLLLFYPINRIYTSNSLKHFNFSKFKYIGDTKIDRVYQRLKREKIEIESLLSKHVKSRKNLLVIGNAYLKDVNLLIETLKMYFNDLNQWHFIVIPYRPEQTTELNNALEMNNLDFVGIQIIPAFGNLLHYYAIADMAWVGGGFDSGIHNVFEAFGAGKQIVSGPNLNMQPMAIELKGKNILKLISDHEDFKNCLLNFKKEENPKGNYYSHLSNKIFTNIVDYESAYSS